MPLRRPRRFRYGPAILAATEELDRKMGIIMSEQANIDEQTAAIEAYDARIEAATTAIGTEIDALEAEVAAGNPGDFTALRAAVAQLGTDTTGVEAEEGTPPVTGP